MIQIIRQERFSRSLKTAIEDIASVYHRSSWVLDASSSLTGRKYVNAAGDGAWFVHQWDQFLRRNVADFDRSLSEIVALGVAQVEREYVKAIGAQTIDRTDVPSASIALVRFREQTCEYFSLGDCTLILRQGNRTKMVEDKRVWNLDQRVVTEVTRLQREFGLTHEEALQRAKPMLLEHRRRKNQTDGYWVLGMDKEAINYAQVGDESLCEAGQGLLMTDGFAQGWETFQLAATTEAWLDYLRVHKLEAVYSTFRNIAEADHSCVRFPRLKLLDDASAVLIEFKC